MGFLRKKKKKRVFIAEVVAAPMFDLKKDLLDETIPRMVVEKVKKNQSAKDYLLNYGNAGAAQLFQYYLSGKYNYMNRLPDASIGTVGVPSNIIENVIKGIEGTTNIRFNKAVYNVPDDDAWVEHQLQQVAGYDAGLTLAYIDGYYYSLVEYEYDEILDRFIANLETLHEIQDNDKRTRKYQTSYLPPEEWPEPEIPDPPEPDPDEEEPEEPPDPPEPIPHVKVTIETTYFSEKVAVDSSGKKIIISSTVTGRSTDIEIVPRDEAWNYVNDTIIFSNVTENPELSRTFNLVSYQDDYGYFFADYTLLNTGRTKLWFYDPALNIYPQLKPNEEAVVNIETYPITLLRNGVFSVNEYNLETKEVTSGNKTEVHDRPDLITEERFKDTEDILKKMGLNLNNILDEIEENKDADKLQDAFITVALSPTTNLPIVSKSLYILFDYIYSKLSPTQYGQNVPYYYVIEEEPFNSTLQWDSLNPTISNEVIGTINSYSHSVNQNINYIPIKTMTVNYDPNFKFGSDYSPSYDPKVYGQGIPSGTEIYYHNGYMNVDIWGIRYRVEPINSETARLVQYQEIKSDTLVLKKQITNTQVRTITIRNTLNLPYRLNKTSPLVGETSLAPIATTTISRIASGKMRSDVAELLMNNEDLVIPLPKYVVDQLSYMEQVSLMGASLYTIFYASEWHVISYYKYSEFGQILGAILAIAAIVINIWSGGATTPLTASMIVMVIAKTAAIGIALTMVIRLVSDAIDDPMLRTAVSLAVIVAAAYVGGAFDNFSLDLTTAFQLGNMSVKATDIYTGALTEGVQSSMAKLQNEAMSFMEAYESRMEEFTEILSSFTTGLDTDFLVDLATDTESVTEDDSVKMWSPSFLHYMMIDAYRDMDILYDKKISTFVDQQLLTGVIDT